MSRVHKIGNIYSRVDGLIRKNQLSQSDKPLWFDVYKQFPPKYNPHFKRVEPEMKVRQIFYKEDALRAKIHKMFQGNLGLFRFEGKIDTFSQRLLKTCLEHISQGIPEDEAIEKLKVDFNPKEKKAAPYFPEESKLTNEEAV